ncbi:glycogen/starch/alpha-glucan phosphorylase [Acidihalobacter ferrooxydans]|uniref:Alpha-1,4 glucan phosphorylase n=1 Tax=Acidihalobacter ferrooxydans TaxID=1765967 RepID=A0A1P8UK28_9GAMM|nr:glycogen/starch/alpha-glucan phosphorylase [Acidihalobacter ferrooxydans]APZ44188.1 glycogen phosphorylase [Acidihalobacter ferrooxydans]
MSSNARADTAPTPRGLDEPSLKKSILSRLTRDLGTDPEHASPRDWLNAATLATRERLLERWLRTRRHYDETQSKRVFYLSLEFLIGRLLINSLMNLGIYEEMREALDEYGVDLLEIAELEPDAALGNGGLGRLAACILDSMATQCIPGYGYGIRYDYGMFRQEIENGEQVEKPDAWLRHGNHWEVPRPDHSYVVRFHGYLVSHTQPDGTLRHHWEDGDSIVAVAYDLPVPGYSAQPGAGNVNDLRLWSARASREFELGEFNEGDYIGAVEQKILSENISRVLYPNDASQIGRELRLKQEYFFVSASLQDIIAYHLGRGRSIEELPTYTAIQLNDTHPAIAVAELMRLLRDEHELPWDVAWKITVATFGYTNHTLMPEALETWPVEMMTRLLPRHMQIIYDINQAFINDVHHRFPGDSELISRVSLIDESGERRVRMAHLAVLGSHRVNGVAELHSRLLKDTLFADFYRIMPERFINVTNGVTQRLWLNQANPGLARLVTEHIGNAWIGNLDTIKALDSFAEDASCRSEFREVKLANKRALAAYIQKTQKIIVDPNALFDVQIKRIHEYKRQLLNVLHVITLYNRIRENPDGEHTPRVVMFAGKAAPAYVMAKRIIRLINDVADVINNDPVVGDRLKCVFLPNYGVSLASLIIPAADLSEQISTAGTEASGTGNMKLALNGALTIGTLDGANVEILEEVGTENIYIFGLRTEDVARLRADGYRPRDYYENNAQLRRVLDMINSDFFAPNEPHRHSDIVNTLLDSDHYLVLADYADYVETQQHVSRLYKDQEAWAHKAMLNTARMGKFSIDRTVGEYASEIWSAEPYCIAP